MYEYKAIVTRIVDGDTIDASVDLGFRVYMVERFRLDGIDAPERFTEAGKAATEWLGKQIPIGTEVTIRTFKSPNDKYGRWVAVILKDGLVINDEMLYYGHAKRYGQ